MLATALPETSSPDTPLMLRDGHTEHDFNELVAAGVDPATTAPREQRTACVICRRPTWNREGHCDLPDHYVPPSAVLRAKAVQS